MKENYKKLGIEENASVEEIETSYKKLQKKYKGNKSKLNEIRKAYDELTKEQTKKQEEKIDVSSDGSILDKITKEGVITFSIGLVLGLIIMMFFFPDRIAELKNGEQVAVTVGKENITANELYDRLKEVNSMSVVLEKVDRIILEDMYTLTESDKSSIESTAQTYINNAQQTYNMTEEEFLKSNNFDNKEEFLKYLELDYMRSTYFKEYASTNEEVEKYYNESVHGTINTEHILVKTESMSDEDASSKANEILDKLKNGTSWDDLKNEYRDVITTESVPVDFDSNLESSYKTASQRLSDGSFSDSLVKTSYGYHIIYRKSTEEKPTLDTVKSRVQSILASQKQESDSNIYGKVLIEMRKNAGMEIKDTEIKEIYDYYVKTLEVSNN